MSEKIVYSLEQMPHVVRSVAKELRDQNVHIITLQGPLGAGKTTFVRMLMQEYGVQGVVQSPTFSYMNIYDLPGGKKVYHFDVYRMKSIDEFVQAGFEEFIQAQDAFICIEWPEIVQSIIHGKICAITLDYIQENQRSMVYQVYER
jgi:tRNA threonylcarbamoyladenosine biosynthesis protein TsaE